MYAVITENDESQWSDETGVLFHFPKRYLSAFDPGTKVIYYKGTQKNKKYAASRLSTEPHYFGIAQIASTYLDKKSTKGDHFAVLENYLQFTRPVLAKINDVYLETIPPNRASNYWRDGTRVIDESTYNRILSMLPPEGLVDGLPGSEREEELNDIESIFESREEGSSTQRFVTVYERDPLLRKQAIAIHGDTCAACGFSFKEAYGDYAAGFIHIHHTKPISEFEGAVKVNPMTDLVPLCANCHAVVHRRKDVTLSLEQLKQLLTIKSL